MKLLFLVLAAIACAITPSPSRADWVVLSAAANCDANAGLFSLVPVAETSEPDTRIAVPAGFTEFSEKVKQPFHCVLGKTSIRLVFTRFGPGAAGSGQAAGVMYIDSLTIDGKDVLESSTNFFWQAMSEQVLTRITVRVHGGVADATYCYSNGFDWFVPGLIKDLTCQDSPAAGGR